MTRLLPKDREYLIQLLMPSMEGMPERQAYLSRALGHSAVFALIDLVGAPAVFVPNLISALENYGEIEQGKQALWALLEVIRKDVGVDKQKQIDDLRPAIESLSTIDLKQEEAVQNIPDQLHHSKAWTQSIEETDHTDEEVIPPEQKRVRESTPSQKLPREKRGPVGPPDEKPWTEVAPTGAGHTDLWPPKTGLIIAERIPEDVAHEYLYSMRPIPPESPGFYMAPCLVSNELFHCFVRANNYWHPLTGECTTTGDVDNSYLRHWVEGKASDDERNWPVTNVSFRVAEAFVQWLSKLIVQPVRLPTFEEWQVAASAGRVDWVKAEIREGRVNYHRTAGALHAVEDFDPNPFGVRDLLGNAYDMCISPGGPHAVLELAGGCHHSTEAHLKDRIVVKSDTTCLKDASFRCIRIA
jgi:hypothetical protein